MSKKMVTLFSVLTVILWFCALIAAFYWVHLALTLLIVGLFSEIRAVMDRVSILEKKIQVLKEKEG